MLRRGNTPKTNARKGFVVEHHNIQDTAQHTQPATGYSASHRAYYTNSNSNSNITNHNVGDPSSKMEGNIETTEVVIIPKLAYTEINLGRVLGEGGFCRVREIASVDLDEVYDTSDDEAKCRKEFARDANAHSPMDGGGYVLKTLRDDLPEEEHTKGIIDLAIEADFLSVLHHPNIIGMRAVANSDPHESRFFVVLERLTQTLEKRFNYWRGVIGDNVGYWLPCYGYCCAKTPLLHAVWKERIAASLDIAKAIQHLHHLGIVYRDLKPDNIGFDRKGNLKIFDFGLAKKIAEVESTQDGNYRLTGHTGSLRYMAPEVACDKPYNLSCDMYSFGIIFWQICSLTTPYAGFTEKMHGEKIVRQGYRPTPDPTWPLSWVELMQQCWSREPNDRPDSQAVVDALNDRYLELLEEDGVLPTRANEIKAKKRRKQVAPENTRLDVDTRISTGDDTAIAKQYDTEIV